MSRIITIDGVKIKNPNNPSGFRHSYFQLSKAGRTADGTMTKDVIANKQKWFFVYDVISHNDLMTILNLLFFTDESFFTLTVTEGGSTTTHTVYVGDLDQTAHRGGSIGGWYYKNFTFNLIER